MPKSFIYEYKLLTPRSLRGVLIADACINKGAER